MRGARPFLSPPLRRSWGDGGHRTGLERCEPCGGVIGSGVTTRRSDGGGLHLGGRTPVLLRDSQSHNAIAEGRRSRARLLLDNQAGRQTVRGDCFNRGDEAVCAQQLDRLHAAETLDVGNTRRCSLGSSGGGLGRAWGVGSVVRRKRIVKDGGGGRRTHGPYAELEADRASELRGGRVTPSARAMTRPMSAERLSQGHGRS